MADKAYIRYWDMYVNLKRSYLISSEEFLEVIVQLSWSQLADKLKVK